MIELKNPPHPMVNQTEEWARLLRALGDSHRLHIVNALLRQHFVCVKDLAAQLNMRLYNVSRHLKVLERAGLVRSRQEGTMRSYSIDKRFHDELKENDMTLDLGCCSFQFKNLE